MDLAIHIAFWSAAALLVYAQVGYLALTMLLAAFMKRTKPPKISSWPRVTLVIPAHNEETVLEAKLKNSLAIEYPEDRLEIVVASDGSIDRTVEIAEQFVDKGIRLMQFAERRGKASVLNDAVSAANGDLLCLCDANVMFYPNALEKMVTHFEDARVGAVSGDVRLASGESSFGEGESLYYSVERAIHVGESWVGSMVGVDGGMYVVRRELYQPLAPSTILDEFVTSMNVINQGKRIVYEPQAIATENGTPTAMAEFNRRVRVTGGAMQVLKRCQWPPLTRPIELWQFSSHKLLRWIEPLVLPILLLTSAALWNEGVLYKVAFIAQVAFYFLGIVGTLSLRFRETRIGGVIFYFVMSHTAMAVGIVKGLFNLQPATWSRTDRTSPSEASSKSVFVQTPNPCDPPWNEP